MNFCEPLFLYGFRNLFPRCGIIIQNSAIFHRKNSFGKFPLNARSSIQFPVPIRLRKISNFLYFTTYFTRSVFAAFLLNPIPPYMIGTRCFICYNSKLPTVIFELYNCVSQLSMPKSNTCKPKLAVLSRSFSYCGRIDAGCAL